MPECEDCKLIAEVMNKAIDGDEFKKRIYWLSTELFVSLHNGKDYCEKGSDV